MSFTQIAEIQQVYDQVEGLTTRSALPSAPPLTRRGRRVPHPFRAVAAATEMGGKPRTLTRQIITASGA
jgi:hypothetical protein